MSDMQVRGPLWGGPGAPSPLTGGISGNQRVADSHARYASAVLENRAFYLPLTNGSATAYTGGAAGTPLFCIHNPTGSNKIAIIWMVGLVGRVAASAAGTAGLSAWGGPSVVPTGTKTTPINALTQAASGSGMLGFVNAALTGSTALTVTLPLWEYYWATAAGATKVNSLMEIAGALVCVPGNEVAIGLNAALTSATYDGAMYWEEVPYLPQG